MGKYKEKYRRQKEVYDALKDDVEDLIIAVASDNSEEIVHMIDIITRYYFTKSEEFQMFKTYLVTSTLGNNKGEQDATQL